MQPPPSPSPRPRPHYRPPVGMPLPRQRTAGSAIASVLLHAFLIFLILGPVIAHDIIVNENKGAGGPGPAGGGGGGRRGGAEKATYVEMAPPPPPPPAKQAQTPAIVPPPVVKPPEPQPEPPKPEVKPEPAPQPAATTANATGTGGTGNDGGRGNGPGTGGGVGSGEGTGRGSGNGPGTGGGTGRIYPPYVTNLALLPMPVPSRVRPYTLTAVFEVDERGNAKLLSFNESKDSDYNKKIRAMLQEIRFRPATRADGTPVRDTTTIVAEAKL